MKGFYSVLVLFVAILAAHGQGQFYFNNRIPPDINARFVSAADYGTRSSIGSPDYTVSLYGGPAGAGLDQLVPLDPPSTSFRGPAGTAKAGYVVPVTVTVPNVLAGQSASVLLVLSFSGVTSVCFNPYTVVLGGGTTIPPNLPMGTGPLVPPVSLGSVCIPEPPTVGLGLAAIAVFTATKSGVRKGRSG
jgi:hypothetical protein